MPRDYHTKLGPSAASVVRSLMSDGRERTTADIAHAIGYTNQAVGQTAQRLAASGELLHSKFDGINIWRAVGK